MKVRERRKLIDQVLHTVKHPAHRARVPLLEGAKHEHDSRWGRPGRPTAMERRVHHSQWSEQSDGATSHHSLQLTTDGATQIISAREVAVLRGVQLPPPETGAGGAAAAAAAAALGC